MSRVGRVSWLFYGCVQMFAAAGVFYAGADGLDLSHVFEPVDGSRGGGVQAGFGFGRYDIHVFSVTTRQSNAHSCFVCTCASTVMGSCMHSVW